MIKLFDAVSDEGRQLEVYLLGMYEEYKDLPDGQISGSLGMLLEFFAECDFYTCCENGYTAFNALNQGMFDAQWCTDLIRMDLEGEDGDLNGMTWNECALLAWDGADIRAVDPF